MIASWILSARHLTVSAPEEPGTANSLVYLDFGAVALLNLFSKSRQLDC